MFSVISSAANTTSASGVTVKTLRVISLPTVSRLSMKCSSYESALMLALIEASRKSPRLTMPTSRPFSTTGRWRMRFSFINAFAAGNGVSGGTMMHGLVMISRTRVRSM